MNGCVTNDYGVTTPHVAFNRCQNRGKIKLSEGQKSRGERHPPNILTNRGGGEDRLYLLKMFCKKSKLFRDHVGLPTQRRRSALPHLILDVGKSRKLPCIETNVFQALRG